MQIFSQNHTHVHVLPEKYQCECSLRKIPMHMFSQKNTNAQVLPKKYQCACSSRTILNVILKAYRVKNRALLCAKCQERFATAIASREFQHLVKSHICDPDVIILIKSQSMWHKETVKVRLLYYISSAMQHIKCNIHYIILTKRVNRKKNSILHR